MHHCKIDISHFVARRKLLKKLPTVILKRSQKQRSPETKNNELTSWSRVVIMAVGDHCDVTGTEYQTILLKKPQSYIWFGN